MNALYYTAIFPLAIYLVYGNVCFSATLSCVPLFTVPAVSTSLFLRSVSLYSCPTVSSEPQSCLTLCNTMNCNMPGFLSITNSQTFLKLMSIELVMQSNHFFLCCPLTHLEPEILQCEVKWALENITMIKDSGGDEIPAVLFQMLKNDSMKVLHSI